MYTTKRIGELSLKQGSAKATYPALMSALDAHTVYEFGCRAANVAKTVTVYSVEGEECIALSMSTAGRRVKAFTCTRQDYEDHIRNSEYDFIVTGFTINDHTHYVQAVLGGDIEQSPEV